MNFKGFEGGYKPSEISGKDRLFYDKNNHLLRKFRSMEITNQLNS